MPEPTPSPSDATAPDGGFERIAEHVFPRAKATVIGLGVGILIGIGNSYLDLDFSFGLELVVSLLAAIVVVLLLHEALHGWVGMLFGYRPLFGIEPPLVYTTFKEKIPRGHLVAIALAPLVVLDTIFITMYAMGVLRLFMDLCFAVNTIGAMGDVWIAFKVSGHRRGTFVQDTKSGVEVWRVRAGADA